MTSERTPETSDARPDLAGPGQSDRQAGLGQLAVLLAGVCMPVLGATLISPVLPQMQRHFSGTTGSDVLVPMVLVLPVLFIALTAPFAGFFADKVDRKKILLIAMVVYAVVGTAPVYLDSLGAIIGSRALLGICEGVIMPCCTTLIGDYWSGARRAKYLGLSTLVATLAATVFLALGGLLGVGGWHMPFWMYLAPLALVVPMVRLLWRPARAPQATGAPLEPLPRRLILVPCLFTVFGGIVFYALIVELPYVLDAIGVESTAVVGGVSAAMSLATAVGSGLFGRLTGRPAKVLVPLELGGATVGLVVVFATASVPVIALGAMITGFSTGLLLPTLLVWTVNRLTYAQRGRGTGWWNSALTFGQFCSPLVVAGLGAAAGGLRPAVAALAVLAAGMAGIVLVVQRHQAEPLVTPAATEPLMNPSPA